MTVTSLKFGGAVVSSFISDRVELSANMSMLNGDCFSKF